MVGNIYVYHCGIWRYLSSTVAGKIFSAIIALLGIGLVAVPTGIISAGFMENIEDNNKQLTEDNIAKIREILEKYDSKNL